MFERARQLYKLQKEAKDLKKKLREVIVKGTEAGGLVEITVDGELTIKEVKISPDLLKPEKKTDIERYFRQATNQAIEKAQKQAAEYSKGLMDHFKF